MAISRRVVMCSILGVLLVPVVTAAADAPLRYVDEQGVAHWVMSKDQIPQKYRDKVQTPDLPPANSSPAPLPTPRERREERAEPQGEKQPPPAPWGR